MFRATRAFALLVSAASIVYAADPTCTAVASVKNCLSSIQSVKTRTASASSFCYSVLSCTETPTVTLEGTVTTTSTKLVPITYTFEELGTIYTTTETYTDTSTSSIPVATITEHPVFWVQKFLVTTVKAKRDATLHPKDLEGRATTTPLKICSTAVQSKACSCLVTCPTTVTKDKRKTIKEKTTDTSYEVVYTSVPYTEIEYVAIPTTLTVPYTETSTISTYSTSTKTIKCTPSVANPSFYLKATNVPVDNINNKYVQAFPYYFAFVSQRKAAFVDTKDVASLFSLDSKSRLITASTDGTLYGHIDYWNNFQIFSFITRELVQTRDYIYANCTLNPPSGLYEGGLQELKCHTEGTWPANTFYYDKIYLEFYDQPLVLAPPDSCVGRPTLNSCFELVFLVVPVCV